MRGACREQGVLPEKMEAGNSPPDTGGVAAALRKTGAKPTLTPQTGWSGKTKCFGMPDHPVRSIKGSFAASLLMSRPPLL